MAADKAVTPTPLPNTATTKSNRRVGEAGGIQPRYVVPMASESIPASKGTLRAEDVNRGSFFPESPLGTHHP